MELLAEGVASSGFIFSAPTMATRREAKSSASQRRMYSHTKVGVGYQAGDVELPAKIANLARFQGIRMIGDAEAGNRREPQPDRKAERMEERQNSQQAIPCGPH